MGPQSSVLSPRSSHPVAACGACAYYDLALASPMGATTFNLQETLSEAPTSHRQRRADAGVRWPHAGTGSGSVRDRRSIVGRFGTARTGHDTLDAERESVPEHLRSLPLAADRDPERDHTDGGGSDDPQRLDPAGWRRTWRPLPAPRPTRTCRSDETASPGPSAPRPRSPTAPPRRSTRSSGPTTACHSASPASRSSSRP